MFSISQLPQFFKFVTCSILAYRYGISNFIRHHSDFFSRRNTHQGIAAAQVRCSSLKLSTPMYHIPSRLIELGHLICNCVNSLRKTDLKKGRAHQFFNQLTENLPTLASFQTFLPVTFGCIVLSVPCSVGLYIF